MSERKPILPQGLTPNPAFSLAVQVGELMFVSGQVAQDNDGNTVGVGDCEFQTRHIMSRLRTIVEAAGATMQDVVKITTFLTDISHYSGFSKVREGQEIDEHAANKNANSAQIVQNTPGCHVV